MDDSSIVDLYWQRNESAISETASKYGKYLHSISYRILVNSEDAEECVNDTYHKAWRSMPPHRPSSLSTFLGKITRRLSIDMWRTNNADKRGGGEIVLVLDELDECIPASDDTEYSAETKELSEAINAFLFGLSKSERDIFVCRYWLFESIESISAGFGFSQSKTKSSLYRTRKKLKAFLIKEGLI